jgi:hypothetical protein
MFCPTKFQNPVLGGGGGGDVTWTSEAPMLLCYYMCLHVCVCVCVHALQRVSQELDYRIDICRVTKGAHIEHL